MSFFVFHICLMHSCHDSRLALFVSSLNAWNILLNIFFEFVLLFYSKLCWNSGLFSFSTLFSKNYTSTQTGKSGLHADLLRCDHSFLAGIIFRRNLLIWFLQAWSWNCARLICSYYHLNFEYPTWMLSSIILETLNRCEVLAASRLGKLHFTPTFERVSSVYVMPSWGLNKADKSRLVPS